MKFTTYGRLANQIDAETGMQIISTPLTVTDEHSASSYGIPVILLEGEPIDFQQVESINADAGNSKNYSPASAMSDAARLEWLLRMPIMGEARASLERHLGYLREQGRESWSDEPTARAN